MSLSALAQDDSRAILAQDGDSVTLTAPEGLALYVVPCLSYRRGMTRDADGLGIIAESASITVSLADLEEGGLTEPESLKSRGWLAEIHGTTWRLDAAPIDYTLGVATIILKRSA